jgi:flagellar basal-body rod modification protein FlgD
MVSPISLNGESGLEVQGNTRRAMMNREQFLKLLSAELSNQDPMEPMDNTEFLKQFVALEQVESSAAVTDGMRTLERFFLLSVASGFIGKAVKGLDTKGVPIQGMVQRVIVQKGDVNLLVDGQTVPFRNVTEIA